MPLVDDDADITEGFDGCFHIAAELWPGGDGGVVRFFKGDDAAIRPCGGGDGVERGGEVSGADVEVLAAGAGGAEDAAVAEIGGVGVRDGDVEGDHGALDGEVRVLPGGEGFDGEIAGFRGRGDLGELLADDVKLASLLGGGLKQSWGWGCVAAGEEDDGEEG